jgi:hypothetical protein
MKNKTLKQYTVDEKKFNLIFTLEQDEILAPVVYEMFQDLTEVFSRSSKSLINIAQGEKPGEKNNLLDQAVSVAIDLTKIKAWLLSKRYARKLLAVLLVEDGEEFDESKIAEKEHFFAVNATADVTDEVISFFLSSSSIFGKSTQTSLASTAKDSTQQKQ